jgi:hypothetical protein
LNSPLNVAWISVKDWYRILQEDGVTHNSKDTDSPAALLPTKLEENYLDVVFEDSYSLSRTFGLSPEQKSFLFKILQTLLPNKERLIRLGKVQSAACTFCEAAEDNTAHLLSCPQGSEVTSPLLRCIKTHVDNIIHQNIMLLNIPCSESLELPLVWLLSTCLMVVWEERQAGKIARLASCRAELEARLQVLKHTRRMHYTLQNSSLMLEEMLNLHFRE